MTFSSAEIVLQKRNRFAKTISFYAVHVPCGSVDRVTVPVGPVTICDGSASVSIGVDRHSGLKVADYLLGAKVSRSVTFKGFDEIGRAVSVTAGF